MSILKKNKNIAGVLAIFLGTLGIHRFYMGEWKVGLAYLLFFWTGVPTILGIIDGARYFTELADEAPDVDSIEKTSEKNDDEEVDSKDSTAKETADNKEENKEEAEIESEESIEENQEDK